MAFCTACGAIHDDVVVICPETSQPVADAGPCGSRIDRYDVERLLGIGGFGAVYLARHSMLRQQVALKLMRKQRLTDPRTAERFLREARAAAAVSHPHIVQMLDCGIVEGQPFLVMELLAGKDLADVLAIRRRLSLGETLDIAVQSLDALGAAHARGIVHRDMKPSNVLLLDRDPDGAATTRPYVKLLDFGISKVLHEETLATGGNTVLGTPAYMAPEQLLSPSTIDHRADLYALAVMLYEMLAGRLPFEGDSVGELLRRALTDRPQPLRTLAPEVPELVAAVIERGLARDRDVRWATARALKEALQRAVRGESPMLDAMGERPTAELPYDGAARRPATGATQRVRSDRPAPMANVQTADGGARVGAQGTVASVPPRSVRPPPRPELDAVAARDDRDPAPSAARVTSSPWALPIVALALVAMVGVSAAAAVIAWAWDRSNHRPAPIATLDPGGISTPSASPRNPTVTIAAAPVPPGVSPVAPAAAPAPPASTPAPAPSASGSGPAWPADDPEPQAPAPMVWEPPSIGLRSDEVDGIRFEVVRITGANAAAPTDVMRGLEQLRPHYARCRPTGRSELVRMRVITQYDGRASVASADERNPGSAEVTRCAIAAVNAGPVFPRVNEIIMFDVLLRRR